MMCDTIIDLNVYKMINAKIANIKTVYFNKELSAEKIIWQSILDWYTFSHIPKDFCDENQLREDWYEVYESELWPNYFLVSRN